MDNGYSRRLLRYLCDAFRFHHSPIYASSSASSVPHDSDKLNDALRQPKSTQRNGESFITRLRIRKLSQQEEEDSENESIDNDELHDSTPASFRFQRKRLPQFGKNYIPSWMELVKGDMCLTSSGQNSSVSDTIGMSLFHFYCTLLLIDDISFLILICSYESNIQPVSRKLPVYC